MRLPPAPGQRTAPRRKGHGAEKKRLLPHGGDGFQNLGHAFLVLGQLGALGFDELGGGLGDKAGFIQLAADEINVALALFALFFQAASSFSRSISSSIGMRARAAWVMI